MHHRFSLPTQAVTIGSQVMRMQTDFPTFNYSRSNNIPTWIGSLQPNTTSPIYIVKIVYHCTGQCSKPPVVNIESPKICPDTPHRYRDGSLCLYFPTDGDWSPDRFISRTIVPWTALWLAFYEIWLDTNHWYGTEAPHINVQ